MNPALRGQTPPGNSLMLRAARAVNVLRGKAAPPSSAMEVGWRPYFTPYGSYAPNQRKIKALMETYGGEDDGVSWVFACIDLIMMEAGSWPWDIFTRNGTRPMPRKSVPQDLIDLIESPNEDLTYSDFIHWWIMDSLLTGNAYWLKDEQNALGQPLALRRLRPEYTQIAVSDEGRIIGYVYNPPGFPLPIPYRREEIMHYRRGPNPRSEYYGMGIVEGIQRALEADLAETDHVIGFFSDGARISGVLTTGTLTETQFERFRQQFAEEYSGAANAHKILVAEEGTRFDPISEVPAQTGVSELRKMTKDEVLSGFGVPSPMLGGTLTESTYKMEESQDIFSRRMYPLASGMSERFTLDIVINWRLVFRMDATYAEPRDHKITRAGDMLKAGASINDSRKEMNLPPHPEEWANVPVIPQGFAPFGFMTSGGAPSATPVSEGGNVNGNNPIVTEPVNSSDLANSADYLPQTKGFVPPVGFEELEGAETLVVDPDLGRKWILRHVACVGKWSPPIEEFLRGSLSDRREEMIRNFSHLQEDVSRKKIAKADIDHAHVWEGPPFDRDAWDRLLSDLGRSLVGDAWESISVIVEDAFTAELVEIEDRLKEAISQQFEDGVRASHSVRQMQFGDENLGYPGVLSVYDAVVARTVPRAKGLAVRIVNTVSLETMKRMGAQRVEVLDGGERPECAVACNAIWSVQEALSALQGHDDCVRAFVPVDV